LTQAKTDGSYNKLLKAMASLDLLIIGDWGPESLNAATRNDLMEHWMIDMSNLQPSLSVNYLQNNSIKLSAIILWPTPF